jgi:DNA-binding NarL/FixJ family response regulator
MSEGLRTLLESSRDLDFAAAAGSLPDALELASRTTPSVLIIDKAFGAQRVIEFLDALGGTAPETAPVIWGVSVTASEALRFIRAGARGIIRKSADLDTVTVCLRSVAGGATWLEQNVFHDPARTRRDSRSDLTPRERQIVELVGHGLKNREVADELGIRPGTVKVHLKHIFEKTGAQGRFGLALTSVAELGAQELQARSAVCAG